MLVAKCYLESLYMPCPCTLHHEQTTMKITNLTVYKDGGENVTMPYTFYFSVFMYHICSRNAIFAFGISKAN